jgi:ferredoxin
MQLGHRMGTCHLYTLCNIVHETPHHAQCFIWFCVVWVMLHCYCISNAWLKKPRLQFCLLAKSGCILWQWTIFDVGSSWASGHLFAPPEILDPCRYKITNYSSPSWEIFLVEAITTIVVVAVWKFVRRGCCWPGVLRRDNEECVSCSLPLSFVTCRRWHCILVSLIDNWVEKWQVLALCVRACPLGAYAWMERLPPTHCLIFVHTWHD